MSVYEVEKLGKIAAALERIAAALETMLADVEE